MTTLSTAELLAKVEEARQMISEAERELATVLGGMDASPRAEKKHVTDVVQSAFARLHEAQGKLFALQKAATEDDDD